MYFLIIALGIVTGLFLQLTSLCFKAGYSKLGIASLFGVIIPFLYAIYVVTHIGD